MQAHANDLRSEIENDWPGITGDSPASGGPTDVFDAFVHRAVDDWRGLTLTPAVRALVEYAEKMTVTPGRCAEADVQRLRTAGCNDTAIHDAVQVIAYFNYVNRVADGLGVEPEYGLPVWGSRG